jgi:hypothetical protein
MWILKATTFMLGSFVHIMMLLDVEGLANTFKLSEGAPEQLDGELSVVEERFLVGVLGRRLLPLLQLLPTTALVDVVLPSSPLRRRWVPRRYLLLLSVTGLRGGRSEEKDDISLWMKQGKAWEGEGVILTRRGTVRCLCPHPLLHYCQYVPLDCASGSVSIMWGGERRGGAMMSGPLVNDSSQTVAPFQFPFTILLHG